MKKLLLAIAATAIASASTDAATLFGTWPHVGGPITITAMGGPIEATGLNFVSVDEGNDGLIPIPVGDLSASAPFDFLLANNPRQVRLGNLIQPVSLEGSIVLNVGAAADAQIKASWVDGVTPIPFEISTVPEPSGIVFLFFLLPLWHRMRRRRAR